MLRRYQFDAPFARLVRAAARHAMKLARPLGLVLGAALLAAPALAAPSYQVTFARSGFGSQYSNTQATPFEHGDTYTVPSSTAIFTGSGFAYPGHAGIDNHVEQFWPGAAGGSRYEVYAKSTATDFVITGPAGPSVTGDLHLRVRANLEHVGGTVGTAGHAARLNVDVRARIGALIATGDLTSSNFDTHGFGILAGLTNPVLDFPFVLSGTYPVGTPFDVVLYIFGTETTSGSSASSPNPGYVRADAGSNPAYGLFLEEVGGQVMTLPAGYTLNSPSWYVVDNHFTTILGVEPEGSRDALRLSAHPNPCFGHATVSFELPRSAHVRLRLFDVTGRLVRTLADGWQAAGTRHFDWDGRADDGGTAGAGLYFARGEADGRTVSHRIVRVR